MTKKKAFIFGVILIAVLLWLLWRKRKKVAQDLPIVNNVNYLTYNTPALNMPAPIYPPSNRSCGCNPLASQYLSGVSDSLNKAQDDFQKKLDAWAESTNGYFQSNFFS